jgi:uncharacterized protein (TIGR00369 family)
MTIVPNESGDPFITKWNKFYSSVEDLAATLGLVPVAGDNRHVRLRMPLRREISQPGGMFSAAALYGLADVCGTFLAMEQLPEGKFPLAIQSSLNAVRNTKQGSATATSTLVSSGRTLIVTETKVCDDDGGLLATVITTYVTPR